MNRTIEDSTRDALEALEADVNRTHRFRDRWRNYDGLDKEERDLLLHAMRGLLDVLTIPIEDYKVRARRVEMAFEPLRAWYKE